MSFAEIRGRVADTAASSDWAEVMRWESSIFELVQNQEVLTVMNVYWAFLGAYHHTRQLGKASEMRGVRGVVSGASKHFSQQVEEMYQAAFGFAAASDPEPCSLSPDP